MSVSWTLQSAPAWRGLILLVLAAFGWVYLIADLSAVPNLVAQAGPGMVAVAAAQSMISGSPLPPLINIPMCGGSESQWAGVDFAQAFAMWFAMVVAMMLPLVWRVRLLPGQRQFFAFLAGYASVWIPYCVAAVLCQWLLRSVGYLDEYLVSSSPVLNAAVLSYVAAIYVLRFSGQTAADRRCGRHETTGNTGFRYGFDYGVDVLRTCAPLMMVMFVVRLMNILAMAALTVIMFFECKPHVSQAITAGS